MTKTSLRKTVSALGIAIALAAGSAQAYTPNDVSLANNSFVDVTTSGLFSFGADLFHFTLSSPSNISIDMSNLLGSDITFAETAIESAPGVDVYNSGWFGDLPRPATYSISLSNLLAGSYTLQVWGYTTSTQDSAPGDTGSYRVALGVSPVPEPAEWAMLMAGLGLVGAIARRRSPTR